MKKQEKCQFWDNECEGAIGRAMVVSKGICCWFGVLLKTAFSDGHRL